MKRSWTAPPIRYWFTILLALITAGLFGMLNYGNLFLNAVPWGIIALILTAWFGKSQKDAIRLGAVFGFVLSYAYLWFDNHNPAISVPQILMLIPLIILPSLFGLLCGAALGYLGGHLRKWFGIKRGEHP